MRADRGKLKSGGDGSGPAMQGNPTVETVVSLYSGIVKVREPTAPPTSTSICRTSTAPCA